jgi:ferric-dicitrate binding protein FerR (iron transport regulator)
LEGEKLSEDEMSVLREWIADHPEEADDFRFFSEIWTAFDTKNEVTSHEVDKKWRFFRDKYLKSKTKNVRLSRGEMLKYAAALIIGVLITSLVFILGKDNKVSRQIVEVPYGAKSTIQLSDGSEVILNAGSFLIYDTRFNTKNRTVNLVGEAYFKIAKSKKPFTVVAEHMTVKAYGTVFNVKAYPGEKVTETTLIEGSIGVKLKKRNGHFSKEIFLKPDEQIVYTVPEDKSKQKGKVLIVKNIDPNLSTAWVNGNIQVRSKTLKELAVQLERKYNVNIYIMDKDLESKRFTGLLKNETIEQIMQVLKLSAHIDYKIENREIWLYDQNKINN